ncbi:hypothetical protein PghCCS26_42100 [Paenibacillus glycanilyticus]|uniref:Uncharacterized protein n=1 Tax=Paenibacillus glycanilyticus TaxID=126569 RepID=A0ABQ6NR95_9BACL|nr:hypothetical protein [Paenibacillus glycanilyticus]GMK47080.1 hypothetical protein PghCCS26_42100 [Paenibacillus glycanilyticus]
MTSVLAVLALAAGAFWLEAPGLIRRRQFRELFMFLVLLLIGTVLYSLLMLQLSLPNPFMLVKWMFRWMGTAKSF